MMLIESQLDSEQGLAQTNIDVPLGGRSELTSVINTASAESRDVPLRA
jgi:molybdopterin-binding protein